MEIWKEVPGYEGLYSVSDMGRVQNMRTGRVLKPTINGNGYLAVTLKCLPRKPLRIDVHILIMMAFRSHVRKGSACGVHVDHIDGNKLNNNLDNLQIITHRENCSKDKKGSSKYTGVSWHKRDKKWEARISIKGKRIYLGLHETELEASEAYQLKLKEI